MKVRYSPSGIHCFDRETGLNILFDEVSVPEAQWAKAPRYVSIALTNACDLHCSFCYASKYNARLSYLSVLEWAHDLDAAGTLGIGFGGGEPTLFPEFPGLCQELHQTTQLAITMTTHGHRFDSSLVAKLVGHVDFIRLSMDGIGATYEKYRGRSFTTFREKLSLIRETTQFGINYVVTDETIKDLPQAAEFVFKEGARELLLLPEIGTDGHPVIQSATKEALSAWVSENHERCRLATSANGIDAFQDVPFLQRNMDEDESFSFLHIDATGTLKKSAFAATGIRIGITAPSNESVEVRSADSNSTIMTAITRLRRSGQGENRSLSLEVLS